MFFVLDYLCVGEVFLDCCPRQRITNWETRKEWACNISCSVRYELLKRKKPGKDKLRGENHPSSAKKTFEVFSTEWNCSNITAPKMQSRSFSNPDYCRVFSLLINLLSVHQTMHTLTYTYLVWVDWIATFLSKHLGYRDVCSKNHHSDNKGVCEYVWYSWQRWHAQRG